MKRLVALMMFAVSLGAAAQSDDMSQQGFTQVHQSDSTIFWLSDQAFSFVEAQALAASLGAHLATFSTLAESNAVSNAINSANVLFGLYQDSEAPSYAEPAGGWTWVTGEEFNWSNWDSNQPNNTSSVYGEESVGHLRDNQKWNDVAMLYDGYQVLLETPNTPGCTSPNACNFDPLATSDDGTCELSGCMDTQACNFDAEAACDDGSCDYSCCPGPGCCLDGQHWDWELNGCVITNPADINFDGCVQLNDLLDLLSAYGDCGSQESVWQCGDPLEYQGYDYETVQIGEQCWFAENLQAFQYRDGTEIQSGMAVAFANESILQYGLMYSGGVILDGRSVCPSGWSVPGIASWQALTDFVGENGFEGSESIALRSSDGWTEHPAGIDAFGFAAEPGGFRYNPIHPYWGEFAHRGASGYWWTSTDASPGNLFTASLQGQYFETNYPTSNGMSIRCLKDAE